MHKHTLLITGGAGFIGSHTLIELLKSGYNPIILDNYTNSSPEVFNRLKSITGHDFTVIKGDIRDKQLLLDIFKQEESKGSPVKSVIHFAALKSVGESVSNPLAYYENNVSGSMTLLQAMQEANVNQIVFSSSATVYGQPEFLPYTEDHPIRSTNPYGWSKVMTEQVLKDACVANSKLSAIALRYFNPIGAHESGLIGEDPSDIPNNLFPFITQVAVGKLKELVVFGNDYDTVDGTGVRDYIHVCDLAEGHIKAVDFAINTQHTGFLPINLGTGKGTSVLELVNAFTKINNVEIPYAIKARRPGDIASAWANPQHAMKTIGWQASRNIEQMCRDGWNWQQKNPNGFK